MTVNNSMVAISQEKKIQGLDTLRFICAFTVMIGHFGGVLPSRVFGIDPPLVLKGIAALGVNMFNGPAAVIVFFVISGFCIHFPNKAELPSLSSYYTRRLIRILIPAVVALAIWRWLGIEAKWPELGIFWSIICEVVYYIIYPTLRRIRDLIGWAKLIVISYVIAYAYIFYNLDGLLVAGKGYASFGWMNWLVGLPCWLLGCWLAEKHEGFPDQTATRIWCVRGLVVFTATCISVAYYHIDSVYSANAITLNVFALMAFWWVGCEIAYRRNAPPVIYLESAGTWSYSLYAMHKVADQTIDLSGEGASVENFLKKYFAIFLALLVSYIFYLIVERPSHVLAKNFWKYIKYKN